MAEKNEDNVSSDEQEAAAGTHPTPYEEVTETGRMGVPSEEEAHTLAGVETNPKFKWYVVHTYSGYENRARQGLEERIRQARQEQKFGEILIPTENVVELAKGGQKKTSRRKFFPGYMLVQMELDDDSWHLVKSTPKITGFVGSATSPPAVPEAEVLRLTQQIDEGTLKPKPRVQFEEGESVLVIDGPFRTFPGVVDFVNSDKAKVRVLVSIFGRNTSVELDFIQVEKA